MRDVVLTTAPHDRMPDIALLMSGERFTTFGWPRSAIVERMFVNDHPAVLLIDGVDVAGDRVEIEVDGWGRPTSYTITEGGHAPSAEPRALHREEWGGLGSPNRKGRRRAVSRARRRSSLG